MENPVLHMCYMLYKLVERATYIAFYYTYPLPHGILILIDESGEYHSCREVNQDVHGQHGVAHEQFVMVALEAAGQVK